MDELNESRRRNQDLTKRMYLLEADIANRVYNLSQAEEQIQDLQEHVGRLQSGKNESELKIDLEKCKESMNTFARVNADCKNKIGELNQCLRENSILVAQNTEAVVTPEDKGNISSSESDRLRISINPQEKVKDQLILQLREDLETCLWSKPNQIRSVTVEQTSNEDCASPCTITRGVGVVNQKFEDLKSGDVIRNLTEQNQKLQQEVRDLQEQSNPEISSAENKTLVQIYESESIEKDGNESFARIADTVTKVVDIVKLFEKSDQLPSRFKTSNGEK
ncbi:uncharacterized protein LOC111703383 [Eurytemora carolleeae]|uniref:uncharacterized protein LOC111703383 n=1 Tax=Eurytemora carolleeae TaxID=1294199 RepID=UPI000C78BEB6|nr:uncharacterized protein LOC111703383 [Eurytemora carolleeae]|eukprot:XP_023331075.1 uncharacterized protein LOC111703383 [Eurytemora affinis]